MNEHTTLILGGARSGKSTHGEMLAADTGLNLVYVATGEPSDQEMQDRIMHHRESRGARWNTIEEPVNIAAEIRKNSDKNTAVLVDCLTIWMSNLMFHKKSIQDFTHELIDAIESAHGPVFLVSNEVGQGIVPRNALAREFRDEAGRLNQTLAASLANVVFVIAGLPMVLKKNGKNIAGGTQL